jgi:hypothetical protein
VEDFLCENRLDLIVRAHEVVSDRWSLCFRPRIMHTNAGMTGQF